MIEEQVWKNYMSFICNQARKARIVLIRLVRVCGYWIGKICSPRKEHIEQDGGAGLLLSISLCKDIRRADNYCSETTKATKPLAIL